MYTSLDHYLTAIPLLLPLTLFCYWLTYLVLRQARDFKLSWNMQFAGMALAGAITPFVVALFYKSLAEVGKGDTFVQYFSIGFIASAAAQVAVWVMQKKLDRARASAASPQRKAATGAGDLIKQKSMETWKRSHASPSQSVKTSDALKEEMASLRQERQESPSSSTRLTVSPADQEMPVPTGTGILVRT